MVFKKLVSGIASLAIAGSMFAGLAVTASADDDVTYIVNEDYDDGTTSGWTLNDATGTFVANETDDEGTVTGYCYQMYWEGNSRAQFYNLSSDKKTAAGTSYVAELDLKLYDPGNTEATQFAVLGSSPSYSSNNTNYGITSGYTLFLSAPKNSTTWTTMNGSSVSIEGNQNLHIKVAVDGAHKMSYTTITDEDGTALFTQEKYSITDCGCSGFYVRLGRAYGAGVRVDNLQLRAATTADFPSITYHTVTTNYKYAYTDANGDTQYEEIAEPTKNTQVEDGTSYTTPYESVIYKGDYTYTYESGATTATITADTEYDILYTRAERKTYNATLTAYDGDNNVIATYKEEYQEPATGATFVTGKFILKDGVYYAADEDTFTRVLSGDDNVVTYTKRTDVVAYAEAEDFSYTNSQGPFTKTDNSSASGGQTATYQGCSDADRYMYTTVTIATAGYYTVGGYVFPNYANNNYRPLDIYVDTTPNTAHTDRVYTSNGNISAATSFTSDSVYLTAGEHKIIASAYSANLTANLDYIYVATAAASKGTLEKVDFAIVNSIEGASVDDDGVLTYDGGTYYGYKSELINCSGKATGTFVGTNGKTATVKSSTTITSADTVIYVIANAELDTDESSITFE